MAKKKKTTPTETIKTLLQQAEERLPEAQREGFKRVKSILESYTAELEKAGKLFPHGIALLPPPVKRDQQGQPLLDAQGRPQVDTEKIVVLVHYDDQDDEEHKQDWYEERIKHARSIASRVDENLQPYVVFTRQLWQDLMDARYDIPQQLSMGLVLHDEKGILTALRVTEVHKNMVLKRFERYIVSYVLAGSLTQGRSTEKSDIDVFIVVDDTDVKRMTRFELMEKLRAIIYGMAIEAGDLTGVRNKLNIQVYILTDFWQYVQEANPIIFTFLRDGVPLYDRGLFMPWKLLLKQGRLKPSPEAIDAYMQSGRQMVKRAEYKLKEIGMEDIFWAVMTPTQAALMLYGLPPPTPTETVQLVKDVFVKREKLFTKREADFLQEVVQTRKALEHGDKKDFTGSEADDALQRAKAYLEKIEEVFQRLQEKRARESLSILVEDIHHALRQLADQLKLKAKKPEKILEEAVQTGILPPSVQATYAEILTAADAYAKGKLTIREGEKARSRAAAFHRQLLEAVQYARLKRQDAYRIRLQGRKQYEAYLIRNTLYLLHENGQWEKAVWDEEKKQFNEWGMSSLDELENAILHAVPSSILLSEDQLAQLKEHLNEEKLVIIIDKIA